MYVIYVCIYIHIHICILYMYVYIYLCIYIYYVYIYIYVYYTCMCIYIYINCLYTLQDLYEKHVFFGRPAAAGFGAPPRPGYQRRTSERFPCR